jgi:hypothetical protein
METPSFLRVLPNGMKIYIMSKCDIKQHIEEKEKLEKAEKEKENKKNNQNTGIRVYHYFRLNLDIFN